MTLKECIEKHYITQKGEEENLEVCSHELETSWQKLDKVQDFMDFEVIEFYLNDGMFVIEIE